MRGATLNNLGAYLVSFISTHAPHARCDCEKQVYIARLRDISTHAPHARCDRIANRYDPVIKISTHAPHARCDFYHIHTFQDRNHFYSRTSCEVRHKMSTTIVTGEVFLLTHLMRGATWAQLELGAVPAFLLTHLMRGATLNLSSWGFFHCISTHAPHARCDPVNEPSPFYFIISTHAPHARCDMTNCSRTAGYIPFLLTHLMRGATQIGSKLTSSITISTHAPHARCDRQPIADLSSSIHFYSRTSCEVRPKFLARHFPV